MPLLLQLPVMLSLAMAATALLAAGQATAADAFASYQATVLSIGDGDTLRVDDRGKRLTIRLACIDAPETAQNPYGQQSRALLASLAPVGSDVSLRVVDIDRYGRTVAEIIRGGQNVNLRMVRRGQAFAYRQNLTNCDPTAFSAPSEERRWTAWGCGASPAASSAPGIFVTTAAATGRRHARAIAQWRRHH